MIQKTRREKIEKSITCYKVLKKVNFGGIASYYSPDAPILEFKYPEHRTVNGTFAKTDPNLVPKAVWDGLVYTPDGYLHAFLNRRDAKRLADVRNFDASTRSYKCNKYVVCKMKIPTIAKYVHIGKAHYGRVSFDAIAARKMKLIKEL
jgi:hypothetical protein